MAERCRLLELANKGMTRASTVNVGGTLFVTTSSTLRSNSFFFERLLTNLDSGLLSTTLDSNDNIFVDRDPQMFKRVLTFLRTPAVAAFTNAGTLSTLQFLKSVGESELQLLRVEADFFGIERLTAAIDEVLAKITSGEVDQKNSAAAAQKATEEENELRGCCRRCCRRCHNFPRCSLFASDMVHQCSAAIEPAIPS